MTTKFILHIEFDVDDETITSRLLQAFRDSILLAEKSPPHSPVQEGFCKPLMTFFPQGLRQEVAFVDRVDLDTPNKTIIGRSATVEATINVPARIMGDDHYKIKKAEMPSSLNYKTPLGLVASTAQDFADNYTRAIDEFCKLAKNIQRADIEMVFIRDAPMLFGRKTDLVYITERAQKEMQQDNQRLSGLVREVHSLRIPTIRLAPMVQVTYVQNHNKRVNKSKY